MGKIRIGPVLQKYGADPVEDGYGWKPMRCPFHEDSQASASVITTRDEQAFRCHGCGIRGDAAALIAHMEGIDYSAAIERAKEIAGEGDPSVHGERSRGRSIPGVTGNHPRGRGWVRPRRRGRPDPGA